MGTTERRQPGSRVSVAEAAAALSGLSKAEVAQRVAEGKVNANSDVQTKSVGTIFREHLCTLFNLVNFIMAALVLYTGELRHMLFMVIVLANLVIGVVQEVRAKRMVDKLTIMTAQDARVIRGGRTINIPVDKIVLDDLVMLSHGDQIPADAVVVAGDTTVNESLLTGESNAIEKHPGDKVLSGSFVDAGSMICKVSAVGADCFVAKISNEAKYVKPVHSEIMDTIRTIIKVATILIVPIGILLFWSQMREPGISTDEAILQTVAGVIGMMPQGLVLLVSSVLAIATTRLGSRKVLVQQAYCIETLARVDVLCLDKTGTITTGCMEVADVEAAGDDPRDARGVGAVIEALSTISQATVEDANETSRAVLDFCRRVGATPLDVERVIPFSSATKLSGCVCTDGRALVMGAAQFVLKDAFSAWEPQVRSFDRLMRVLVVAEVDGFDEAGAPLGEPRVLGFVGIRDQIRKSAAQTMEFFREQGVGLRVISGDDPRTVAAIAEAVGVPDADQYVDASTLETDEDVAAAVRAARVFGRVTPQMKRRLVHAFQDEGHTVAMTGDGVNDVLALKEADCSVAMASGSAATRNVAEIVLADNDFSHMPEVVAEGRRSINNLQRSASLFLMKTVYTALLALVSIFAPPFPFQPAQMSLISGAIIGLPSFVLALEPNHERVKGSFLVNVLSRSLPSSFAIALDLVVTIAIQRALGLSYEEISTSCLIVMAVLGLCLIWRIAQPMNALHWVLLAASAIMIVCAFTVLRWYFQVVYIPVSGALAMAAMTAACAIMFNRLYDRSVAHAESIERRDMKEQLREYQQERKDERQTRRDERQERRAEKAEGRSARRAGRAGQQQERRDARQSRKGDHADDGE